MFATKKFSLLFLTIGLIEAGYITVKVAQKCSIHDGECQKKMLETLLHEHSLTGIEELGIPPLNPYVIKDTTVSVLGMVNLTMINGLAEGLTNCAINTLETDIVKGYVSSESSCERVTVSGHYKIEAGPLVQSLSGNSVSGDGDGKIEIDQMTLKMKIPFSVEKHEDDGEIYIRPKVSEAEYSTKNINNIYFEANHVMLGNQEVSQQLTRFMNNNWRIINTSFGKYFSDKIMEVFYGHLDNFFQEIPANNFFTDDLSPYVKS